MFLPCHCLLSLPLLPALSPLSRIFNLREMSLFLTVLILLPCVACLVTPTPLPYLPPPNLSSLQTSFFPSHFYFFSPKSGLPRYLTSLPSCLRFLLTFAPPFPPPRLFLPLTSVWQLRELCAKKAANKHKSYEAAERVRLWPKFGEWRFLHVCVYSCTEWLADAVFDWTSAQWYLLDVVKDIGQTNLCIVVVLFRRFSEKKKKGQWLVSSVFDLTSTKDTYYVVADRRHTNRYVMVVLCRRIRNKNSRKIQNNVSSCFWGCRCIESREQ